MKPTGNTPSLRDFFRRQALKWAALGLLLTFGVGVPSAAYLEKAASEKQIQSIAVAAATAYHSQIVDSNFRLAQLGIRDAFKLSGNEGAVILKPDLTPAYSIDQKSLTPFCSTPNRVCWSSNYGLMSILYPIYFEADQTGDVENYLLVVLKPSVDLKLLGILFGSLIFGFLLQGFGFFGTLSGTAQSLRTHLENWSAHLKTAPSKKYESVVQPPFSDLFPMQQAIGGLHDEIQSLQKVAADEAKASTQLLMLREIGHELRTPLSQVAKFFGALAYGVRRGAFPKEELLCDIEDSIQKMGNIVRQTRALYTGAPSAHESCALVAESKKMIKDFADDPEVSHKSIRFEVESTDGEQNARISPVAFHRITENLIRNAVHAVQAKGKINITVANVDGLPSVYVKDNGSGIAPEIQGKIFDFEFTTKPSRGTGIGLGIVKRLCIDASAKIDFKSEVGEGTEFVVSFQPASPMESGI